MDQTTFRRMKYAEDPTPEAPPPPYLGGFQDLVHGSPEQQHHVQRLLDQYAKDKQERELGRGQGGALGVLSGVPLVAGGGFLGAGGGAAFADSLSRGHRGALNQWEETLQGLKPKLPWVPYEVGKSLESIDHPDLLSHLEGVASSVKEHNPDELKNVQNMIDHVLSRPQLSRMGAFAQRALPVAGAIGGLALGGYGAYRGYKALRDWGERRKGEMVKSEDPALNASVDTLRERAKSAALAKYAGIR